MFVLVHPRGSPTCLCVCAALQPFEKPSQVGHCGCFTRVRGQGGVRPRVNRPNYYRWKAEMSTGAPTKDERSYSEWRIRDRSTGYWGLVASVGGKPRSGLGFPSSSKWWLGGRTIYPMVTLPNMEKHYPMEGKVILSLDLAGILVFHRVAVQWWEQPLSVQGWGASTVSNNPLCIPPAGKYFVPSTMNLQMYVRFTRDDWQAFSLQVLSLLLNWFQLTNTVGRIPMGCGEAKSSQLLKIANDLTSTSTTM